MISFLYPAFLAALLALPLIWYLLRIMPPAPRKVFFPPTRFLIGLVPDKITPSKTPWWMLLLRLCIAALIITALAKPVLNQADNISGTAPLRIILDNSWASAQTWDFQIAKAEESISQASRSGRKIIITTTTPVSGEIKPYSSGIMVEAEAKSVLSGIEPQPWPAKYKILTDVIKTQKLDADTVWLSHGLDESEKTQGLIEDVFDELQKSRKVEIIKPSLNDLPVILRPAKTKSSGAIKKDKNSNSKPSQTKLSMNLEKSDKSAERDNYVVQALGNNGQILDIQNTVKTNNPNVLSAEFDIAENLQGTLSKFTLSGRSGAGGIYLLDDNSKRRNIGIVGTAENADATPLIDDNYYIRRALEPYANITQNSLNELIKADLPMIIMADIAAIPPETLNDLEAWVKKGGLLLRFSGPALAKNPSEQFLLPVKLRSGERSLSGAMTWEKPQGIASFTEDSPFYGIDIPADLTIRQQVLADPTENSINHIWAKLTDGTPLITASPLDDGMIVLVHTTAGPNWSDLPLTGLFVQILQKISLMSGRKINTASTNSHAMLEPVLIMDGFGNLTQPSPAILPIPAKKIDKLVPQPNHPPGIYAVSGGSEHIALNLGTNLPQLKILENLPMGITVKTYEGEYEINLAPPLMLVAGLLFLIDWLAMIILCGIFIPKLGRRTKRIASAVSLFSLLLIYPLNPANAENVAPTQSDITYANGLYLAFIKTGDENIDQLSQRGLKKLSMVLRQRTSVEPDGVAALDIEKDKLDFFPIIYWPVTSSQTSPSNSALKKIQDYLDHGGTILFDTRDNNNDASGAAFSAGADSLHNIIGSLNIPPLAPIKDDHVLGRSFYLLSSFPGRTDNGIIWIQDNDTANGRDGVSPVIIGSNDWAGAWAGYSDRARRLNPMLSASQSELTMRFGVNLVMYALTGNYKADQVHIPFILERLGQ